MRGILVAVPVALLLTACGGGERTEAAAPAEPLAITVSASGWETKAAGGHADHPPELARDGDLTTSFRVEGEGQWLQLTLSRPMVVEAIRVAFVKGDQRVYRFDLAIDNDLEDGTWTTVLRDRASSGTTTDLEEFRFFGVPCQRLRLIGHGNSNAEFSGWFNVAEVGVLVRDAE